MNPKDGGDFGRPEEVATDDLCGPRCVLRDACASMPATAPAISAEAKLTITAPENSELLLLDAAQRSHVRIQDAWRYGQRNTMSCRIAPVF